VYEGSSDGDAWTKLQQDNSTTARQPNLATDHQTFPDYDATSTNINTARRATVTAHVSAFCRASVNHVVPLAFFGHEDEGKHNHRIFLHNVHRFIGLRRFETLSLHEVMQDMKVSHVYIAVV